MSKLLFSFLLFSTLSIHTVFAQSEKQIEQEIFERINEYRQHKGLAPLEENKIISKAAAEHSRDMARTQQLGHQGFDERMNGIIKKIDGVTATAENVAYGAKTAERVVDMWLNSKGHRKNILGNYNYTGISVEKSKDGILYYTQIFVRKK